MRILAAYKPSPEGQAVIEAAKQEAKLRGAELVIARHVKRQVAASATAGIPSGSEAQTPPRDEFGQDIEKVRQDMDTLVWDAKHEGIKCDVVVLEHGDDHAGPLLDLAKDGNFDMIVVGIRRRSRVGKAVLGSESQRILLAADCPVLAVKAARA